MRSTALNGMDPKLKQNFLEWESYHLRGLNPEEIMGSQKARLGYLANPTEQHARIMELRYLFKFTPDYKVTLTDAEKILDMITKGKTSVEPDFVLIVNKDPKRLAKLFNEFWATIPALPLIYPQSEPPAEFRNGGTVYPKVTQLVNRTNNKNIDFINRLKDPNRQTILDWGVATHKMGWLKKMVKQ